MALLTIFVFMALQRHLRLPDGITAPLLPGMATDVIGFGPVSSYGRSSFGTSLGTNGIIPQNVWIHGFKGNPKDGLRWFDSPTAIRE